MKQVKMTFQQEMHSAGPEDLAKMDDLPMFEARITDAAGGEYVVINVFEWAFDNEAEVREMADRIIEMIKTCAD